MAEVRGLLARLYRGFVLWVSLYEDEELPLEQERRRGEVARLLGEFSGNYLARSVWFEGGTRKKVERFMDKSEDLYADFVADIVDGGYARTRPAMADRVSRELGPLRKEAEASLEGELLAEARRRGWRWRR